MTLTPAALDFLRDLYTQRGMYEYRAGHPLEAAKATAFEDVLQVKRDLEASGGMLTQAAFSFLGELWMNLSLLRRILAGMVDGTFVELDGESVVEIVKQPETKQHHQEVLL